jgi:hypothetical protein
MNDSTKNQVEGKVREAKGKSKRRLAKPLTILTSKLKSGARRSAGKSKRRLGRLRKLLKNRFANLRRT